MAKRHHCADPLCCPSAKPPSMQRDELERHLVESASQTYCETNVTVRNQANNTYIPGTNERLRRLQDVLVGRSVHSRRTAPQADGAVLLHGGPHHDGLGFLHARHGVLGRELGSSPELPTSGRKTVTVTAVCSGWSHLTWPPGRTRKIFSSVKITLLQLCCRCFRAYSFLFFWFTHDSSGFLAVVTLWKPSLSSRRRVCRPDGRGGICRT